MRIELTRHQAEALTSFITAYSWEVYDDDEEATLSDIRTKIEKKLHTEQE